jgi:hypothetical protein
MYKYKVEIDRYGGEFVMGTVSNPTYDYWVRRDKEDLEAHIFSDEIKGVPPEHCLYPWYENDDLLHTYGADFSACSTFTITNLECPIEEVCFSLNDDQITENAWVIHDEKYTASPENSVIFTCLSWEKGFWEYDVIETREPFDPSKLETFLYCVDGIYVVDHLRYDGVKLYHRDGTTYGVHCRFWFD